MSPAPPRISVAIVTFNRRAQVTRAINSVLAQMRPDVEIVVLDNASSDGTAEHIAAQFPEVRLVRMPHNAGCPAGRNHAYANCRGEFIVNLDDDGWLADGVFAPLLEVFAQDERIGVVAMRQAFPDEAGDVLGKAMSASLQDVASFSGGVCCLRRDMIVRTGGYPADFFMFAEETYLALCALQAGYRIVSAPHIVMWHPRMGGSHSTAMDYHRFRNSMLVIARLYPLPLLLKYLPLKVGSLLIASLSRGSFRSYVRALTDVLGSLPRTLMVRQPVSAAVVNRQRHMDKQWVEVRSDGRFSPASRAA